MTISCPHCGWKTELAAPKPEAAENDLAGKGRDKIRVIAAVALLLGGAGAFAYWKIGRNPEVPAAKPELKATGKSTLTNKSAETSQSAFERTNNLRVGSITLEKSRNSSVVYAVGVIKNDSDHQRFGLRIELDLLDTAGLKIGTATDYLAILEPGKDWRFKALVLDAKAVSARLVAIREEE